MFAFEPIEKIDEGMSVRVRRLPRTTLAMGDKVALDLNPLNCLQPCLDSNSYVGISHSRTHRPIINGTAIDITAAVSSAVSSWDLFSLQWDIMRTASLCGVADASDDDDWESDDDECSKDSRMETGLTCYLGGGSWIPSAPIAAGTSCRTFDEA